MNDNRAAVFAFSDKACTLAGRVAEILGLKAADIHTTEKFASKFGYTAHKSVCADMGELFAENASLIFVGACGIAVRDIAPHVKNKTADPAVLVIDECGKFVIPILSGHIGGANRLARSLARELGAEAVITTATDINGRFSVDEWAAGQGLVITSLSAAKAVSAAVLVSDVGISGECALPEILPAGLVRAAKGEALDCGIYIGVRKKEPYRTTLRLVPRAVTLGIGCRRGISREAVEAAVKEALKENAIDASAVSRIASIDVKADEEGLLAYARGLNFTAVFYPAEELERVEGEFGESEFVKKTVGVGNVCERAAVCGGNRLLFGKTVKDGVTVAAAVGDWRVTFGESQ